MKFELMDVEKANYTISLMARVLKVTRQGYDMWRATKDVITQRQRKAQELDAKVLRVFEDSRRIYGAPRIHKELSDENVHVDVKTVAR